MTSTVGPGENPSSSGGHTYTISRVRVQFPHRAYPSQVAMMSKIILALQRGQNALLESPTGSGKSLALLCAALAWQRDEARKAREYNRAVEEGVIQPEYVYVDENDDEVDASQMLEAAPDGGFCLPKGGGGGDGDDDDTDDFRSSPPHKRPKLGGDEGQQQDPSPPAAPRPKPATATAKALNVARKIKRKKAPKIYFGTRTHKQIAQIVRELNKTEYRNVNMTILGSRDHTCIHPVVSKMKSRNEGCRELNDRKKNGGSGGCSYMSNVKSKLGTHAAVSSYRGGKQDAWDLEDLVKVGKKARACPYYATRELKGKSDIVFCPYNYLVEPTIRDSMEIYLKGQVVILDEAHNIEDSARSAASWQVTQDELQEAMRDLEKVAQADVLPDSHRRLATLCSQLCCFMDAHKDQKQADYKEFNSESRIWNGVEFSGLLDAEQMGPLHAAELNEHYKLVAAEFQANKEEQQSDDGMSNADAVPSLSAPTIQLLESYFLILGYLNVRDKRHRNDYRVALTKTQSRIPARQSVGGAGRGGGGPPSTFGSWLGRGKKGAANADAAAANPPEFRQTLALNFWCLNPAVAFLELKESLHSVVLTSGTLSPMASFSSELDVRFQLQLEASHVIDRRQVWIGTLSHGPHGRRLNATYKNASTFDFQDEVGLAVAEVCETIPHGVLLFLPSYAMLNRLCERWEQTGVWARLTQRKVVVKEPRFSDEFEASIRHFGDVIEATNDKKKSGGDGGVDGALFIAVCRGKVSEGLDFADNNARAVICVGIPFPNIKDVQVDLKKKYNDGMRRQNQQLLSGNEWYEIQAFRALNQALGRCIRHRRDWGAILMADDRYQSGGGRYTGGLSKWVRAGVQHYSRFSEMSESLGRFREDMAAMEQENSAAAEEEPPPPPPPAAKEVKLEPGSERRTKGAKKMNLSVLDEVPASLPPPSKKDSKRRERKRSGAAAAPQESSSMLSTSSGYFSGSAGTPDAQDKKPVLAQLPLVENKAMITGFFKPDREEKPCPAKMAAAAAVKEDSDAADKTVVPESPDVSDAEDVLIVTPEGEEEGDTKAATNYTPKMNAAARKKITLSRGGGGSNKDVPPASKRTNGSSSSSKRGHKGVQYVGGDSDDDFV